jgi:hypothetical protein
VTELMTELFLLAVSDSIDTSKYRGTSICMLSP